MVRDEGFYLGDGTHCATVTCPQAWYHNVIDPLTTHAVCGPGLQLADDIIIENYGAPALTYYEVGVFGGGTGFFDVTVGLYETGPYSGDLVAGTERTFADNPDYGSPVFLTTRFDPPVYDIVRQAQCSTTRRADQRAVAARHAAAIAKCSSTQLEIPDPRGGYAALESEAFPACQGWRHSHV